MKKILERIKEIQGESPQASFARDCKMSQQTVRNYLEGIQKPSLLFVYNICQNFNVSADWLLGLSDEKSPKNLSEAPKQGDGQAEKGGKMMSVSNEINRLNEELQQAKGELRGLRFALESLSKK